MYREAVVERAMTHYWRAGAGACTVDELCRHAGISKPSLYREFGGEDGLSASALQRYYDVALAPIQRWLGEERAYSQTLDALPKVITKANSAPAGCLYAKFRLSPERLGQRTREHVLSMRDTIQAGYQNWIRLAQERGEASRDLNAAFVGRYLDEQFISCMQMLGNGSDRKEVREHMRLALRGLYVNAHPA